MPILNKDMQMCISIAARPSNVGTRFHNFLYDELGLNYVYKGFAVDDAEGAVRGVRALKIRGAAVSMPHKETVIAFMDELDPSAAAIDAVNTIVNTDGYLKAYNTDYQAVLDLLKTRNLAADLTFAIRGSGGMAKAVVAAIRDAGFSRVVIYSRNEGTGKALAEKYGFNWKNEIELNGPSQADVLVNVTPLGMEGGNEGEVSFKEESVTAAKLVIEAIAVPAETPLIQFATKHSVPAMTGLEIMAAQAALQFKLYTGITLTDDQIKRATEFSRK